MAMDAALMPLGSLHGLARGCQAQLARVVVIPATGNCPHALAGTPLDVQPPDQRLCFFMRHAGHIYAGQRGVKGFLLDRPGWTPHRQAKHEATASKDKADADHQRKGCPPIDRLYARVLAPHLSLYSMRGAPQTSHNYLAAGNEHAASGRFMSVSGPGGRA